MRRFFHHAGERARLRNVAIAHAIKTYDLAPVVYGGDDICFNDGPICSVATLEDLYFPALERAIEPLVTAGIDIVWHCDGNVLPIVDRLIACGITGFQGFQEREANIPLEEMVPYRRRDGGKLIFFGSISVVHTFPFGSPADIRREVERCFRVAAPGGGFCIAPTSSILPETPMENIAAFLDHSRLFGKRFLREMWAG
jgi:uroporphyrinogen decarboxylase